MPAAMEVGAIRWVTVQATAVPYWIRTSSQEPAMVSSSQEPAMVTSSRENGMVTESRRGPGEEVLEPVVP